MNGGKGSAANRPPVVRSTISPVSKSTETTSPAETARAAAGERDLTQMRAEIEELRARLQAREKELLSEKQANETMRQHQAASQQAMMARLAALESPSIGTAQSLSTNQSREARLVKLPSWMRIG